MIENETVESIVKDLIADTELFIVSIKITKNNCITVLIDSMKGVNLETCIILTKQFTQKLDREIEDYELQFASAGIGQDFLVRKQFEKNVGNQVEVLDSDGKKYRGELKELFEDGFSIEFEEKEKVEGHKRKVLVTKVVNFKNEKIKYIKDIVCF